jgi:hypothetical protein
MRNSKIMRPTYWFAAKQLMPTMTDAYVNVEAIHKDYGSTHKAIKKKYFICGTRVTQ